MKTFILIVAALFMIAKFGLAMGGLAFGVFFLLAWLIQDRVQYALKIRDYARKYEHIYVISNHPETEEEIFIQNLDFLIVTAPYNRVLKTVSSEKKWLLESKNSFFCDPSLTEKQRLAVVPIIYQDGVAVNETWKQFRKRVISEIQESRVERHAMLKKIDPIWYDLYSNNQDGIIWEK